MKCPGAGAHPCTLCRQAARMNIGLSPPDNKQAFGKIKIPPKVVYYKEYSNEKKLT